MKVSNRTYIISGGSSGLGLATVHNLLQAHAYVAILDRQAPPSTEFTGDGASASPSSSSTRSSRVKYIRVDITDVERVEEAVEEVAAWSKETGASLGGIVNCAGVGGAELIIDPKGNLHSKKLWDWTFDINVAGTFHLTRFALKHLINAPKDVIDGERGVVVMVSSTTAYDGVAGQIAYAASKGAIRAMTLPMARDLARYGIRVVTIAPGPFTSPLTGLWTERIKSWLKSDVILYPKRFGLPKEFADTVRWILETPYLNGESVKLTAGIRVPAKM